jgi:hypothetical protein
LHTARSDASAHETKDPTSIRHWAGAKTARTHTAQTRGAVTERFPRDLWPVVHMARRNEPPQSISGRRYLRIVVADDTSRPWRCLTRAFCCKRHRRRLKDLNLLTQLTGGHHDAPTRLSAAMPR